MDRGAWRTTVQRVTKSRTRLSDFTFTFHTHIWASQVELVVKNPPVNVEDIRDMGSITGSEDPLEEEMATHSSILSWRIPWTEEPGRLQSMRSQSRT